VRRRRDATQPARRRDSFGRFGWGLIGIIFLVLLCYAVFTKLSVLQSSFTLRADFTTAASQIEQGSPVRIAGVNVGKVTAVGRGPGDGALVTMAINSNGLPCRCRSTRCSTSSPTTRGPGCRS
jgi:ABC-type transporter Mla subunit MlaD